MKDKLVTAVFKMPESLKEWLEKEAARLTNQSGKRKNLSDVLREAAAMWRKQQEKRHAHWRSNGNR